MQNKKKRSTKKEEKINPMNLLEEVGENIEKRLDKELEKYKDPDKDGEIVLESVKGLIKEKKLPEELKPIERIIENIKEGENVEEVDRKEVNLNSLPGYSSDDDNYEKLHKISNENFKDSLKNQMSENAPESYLKTIYDLLRGNENSINVVALKSMINNIFSDDKKEGTVDPDQVDEVFSIDRLTKLIKRAADNQDFISFDQFKNIMQRSYY